MKAEELMIDDWVYNHESNQYQRVWQLDYDNVVLDGYYSYDYNDIEPIPLTPEILEKNGFKMKQKEGESNYEYVAAGGNYIIVFLFFRETIYGISTVMDCELGFSGGLDRIHKCNVKYVHELQHALRLCGIKKEIVL